MNLKIAEAGGKYHVMCGRGHRILEICATHADAIQVIDAVVGYA